MSDRRKHTELVNLTSPPKPEPSHPGYQTAGSFNEPPMQIDADLWRVVVRHLARHIVPKLAAARPARFQVIQGPPGDGKTTSVRVPCSRLGVDLIVVGASELAGATEGAPTEVLERLEAAVTAITTRQRRPMAILFDDFDLSSGVMLDTVESTINGALLLSAMHTIADTGAIRSANGLSVPIFLTGNDFTAARATLLRPGRADVFTFDPPAQSRRAIVAAMFPEIAPPAIDRLLKAHASEPIAFFHAVRCALADEDVDALVAHYGLSVEAITAELDSVETRVTEERVKETASRLAGGKVGRFLVRRR